MYGKWLWHKNAVMSSMQSSLYILTFAVWGWLKNGSDANTRKQKPILHRRSAGKLAILSVILSIRNIRRFSQYLLMRFLIILSSIRRTRMRDIDDSKIVLRIDNYIVLLFWTKWRISSTEKRFFTMFGVCIPEWANQMIKCPQFKLVVKYGKKNILFPSIYMYGRVCMYCSA